jgi:hypothetical protein
MFRKPTRLEPVRCRPIPPRRPGWRTQPERAHPPGAEGDAPRRIDTASDGGSATAATDSTGVVVAADVIVAAEGAVSVIDGILGRLFEI